MDFVQFEIFINEVEARTQVAQTGAKGSPWAFELSSEPSVQSGSPS